MSLVCLLWLLFVAVHDFRQRRVPNWLVLAGAAAALAALAFRVQPFGVEWPTALAGAAISFAFLLVFYPFGLMGAGDVKFAGALGLWAGTSALLPIWIVGSLLAGAHGVLWYALQRWPVMPRFALLLSGPPSSSTSNDAAIRRRARVIPYAAYLAMAMTVWMAWGRQS